MKLHDTDLTPLVDVLPIEVVTDAIGDLSLPDLDDATDLAVELGRSGSRGAVRVVRTVRRHPYRFTVVLSAIVGAALAIAIMRRRRPSSPELTFAEAA
jgi:hypothetical protein